MAFIQQISSYGSPEETVQFRWCAAEQRWKAKVERRKRELQTVRGGTGGNGRERIDEERN